MARVGFKCFRREAMAIITSHHFVARHFLRRLWCVFLLRRVVLVLVGARKSTIRARAALVDHLGATSEGAKIVVKRIYIGNSVGGV